MKAAAMIALMVAVSAPVAVPAPVFAQDHDHHDGDRWDGDRDSNWDPSDHYRDRDTRDERVMSENDRVYRGKDGKYYCKRNDGTTGLVIGGLAGGVLGNVIAGGTLGTLLGAAGGGLLGRNIDRDKNEVKCK